MVAGNKSPLGFGPILLFHLCVLVGGILFQNVYRRDPKGFYWLLGAAVAIGAWAGYTYRGFLWDVFRSFKSAAMLVTLLVLSCILGTFIIQDLDLRRAQPPAYGDPDVKKGEIPPFGNPDNQSTRFALAEAHGWLWLFPNEERKRMTAEKVVLSPSQKAQVELRGKAFGEKAARVYEKDVLASKRRQVNDLTTSDFAREHFEGLYAFFRFCKQFHLFDIFEAWWFYALLALIGVNVIVGTFARAPWDTRSFGVAITHAGIIIVLAGALLDVLTAKEGYIYFEYGRRQRQIASSISDQKNRVHHHLPFRVRIDRFATEYYHQLIAERYDWSRRADGEPWGEGHRFGAPFEASEPIAIRAGVPHTFEGGTIEVTVHEYKPRVFVETDVVEVPNGPSNPALEMGIYANPMGGENLLHGRAPSWLFAKHARKNHLDIGDIRFEYLWAENEREYRELLRKEPIPDNGELILRSGEQQVRVQVRLGGKKRVEIGGQVLQIEFVRISSALGEDENVNLARKRQHTEEPVLWLRVNDNQISVPRDDKLFTSNFRVLKGVDFRFDWLNPTERGLYSIYRIVGAPGRQPVLLQVDYLDRVTKHDLQPGRPVPLVGNLEGFHLAAVRTVSSARQERVVREVSDEQFLKEGGGGKDHLLAAWADVEIRGPQGTVRRELTPFDAPISYGGTEQQPLYRFGLSKSRMALDWFSVLTVVDHQGNDVMSHAVQVNSPLRYHGYRFFQASASTQPNGISVSGISVTYNPGVNFMYMGYYVLTLGVCYIFFLRPMIDRDRRRGGTLFSFEGRLGRQSFWRSGNLVLTLIDVIAILMIVILGGPIILWFFILFWWIPTLWPRLALLVKRCHDINRPGWFLLVPVWSLFEAWGASGSPDRNRFGDVPTEA